jgi:hypothetical protein
MMLSPAERAEFECRGLLRLPGAIPGLDADAMQDRLWRYLRETQGVAAERPQTWAVGTPAHFQALVRTGAFDARRPRRFAKRWTRCWSGEAGNRATTGAAR